MRRTSRQLFIATAIGMAILTLSMLASRHGNRAADPRGDPDWLARVQSYIADREYRAHDDGSGLQAPNRRHGLRTWFTPSGIRVHDRTAGGSPRLLALRLERIGRGSALHPVPAGT